MLGRSKDDPYYRFKDGNETDIGHCTVQIDYFFMKGRRDEATSTVMSAVDSYWGRCRAIRVESKGSKS